MYTVFYRINDIMDMRHFANFHSMMNFIIGMLEADNAETDLEFMIKNQNGEMIYKYIRG